MDLRPLSDQVSAAGQITPEDVPALAKAGFRTFISNRPDGEAPDQPPSAALKRTVSDLGLQFHHIPITPGQMGDAEVAAFRVAMAGSSGKVLAYCRSGARSTTLWTAAGSPAPGKG